jgi:hypothetical protein
MAITLNKTIIRDTGNTIDVTTPYSELNTKADNLVEDVVTHMETELQSMEAQFNSDVAASVAESAASAAAALASENAASASEIAAGLSEVNSAASEADAAISAATATAAADRAEAVVIPTGVAYSLDESDLRATAMSYAAAEALARDNRDKFAGSGFIELDEALTDVNFGIDTGLTANTFTHGDARFNVNGDILKRLSSTIVLPPAPTAVIDTTTTTNIHSKYEFVIDSVSDLVYICIAGAAAGTLLSNTTYYSVRPSVSRTDLIFLESWEEDTSEKGVLYDRGDVQNKATISMGTAGTFAGQDTYSLYGNHQAAGAIVGNSIAITSLSFVNLMTFVANPENNCKFDGDKLIQTRYRIRVVQGLGDTWSNANTTSATLSYATSLNPQTKGKAVSIASDIANTNNFLTYTESIGAFETNTASLSYNGKCYALPIALVHRRNQGAYHPVYNPNGSGIMRNTTNTASVKWYNTSAYKPSSIAELLSSDSSIYRYGGIVSGVANNGRPDGLFYDEVNERDIIDLRMSAHKRPYKEVMDELWNDAIAGNVRGEEGEYFTKTVVGATARRPFDPINPPTYQTETTRKKSNNTAHTDIIATAAVFDASFPDGVNGVWLALSENDTSYAPTGTTGSDGLAVFKVSKKANSTPLQVLKSTDSGATWSALTVTTHYTFSTITNAITFTAGNIPLTTDIVMISYNTHTNMAEATTNAEVLEIGDVWASNYYAQTTNGLPTMLNTLLNKTLAGNTTTSTIIWTERLTTTSIHGKKLETEYAFDAPLKHGAISLVNTNSPTAKTFPYLTPTNGKLAVNAVFKEMKFDVDWGDDSKFDIVSNVSTTTDDNANTVLIGQKQIKSQYFDGGK